MIAGMEVSSRGFSRSTAIFLERYDGMMEVLH